MNSLTDSIKALHSFAFLLPSGDLVCFPVFLRVKRGLLLLLLFDSGKAKDSRVVNDLQLGCSEREDF